MAITVECKRRKKCGYCTDLETTSEANPSHCPKCGGELMIAGTNTPYYDRDGNPPAEECDETQDILSTNIRAAIADRDLTITAAAELFGMKRVQLHRYLSGKLDFRVDQLAAIAKALKTTVSKLTKGVE